MIEMTVKRQLCWLEQSPLIRAYHAFRAAAPLEMSGTIGKPISKQGHPRSTSQTPCQGSIPCIQQLAAQPTLQSRLTLARGCLSWRMLCATMQLCSMLRTGVAEMGC